MGSIPEPEQNLQKIWQVELDFSTTVSKILFHVSTSFQAQGREIPWTTDY